MAEEKKEQESKEEKQEETKQEEKKEEKEEPKEEKSEEPKKEEKENEDEEKQEEPKKEEKKEIPNIKPGMIVEVHQIITETDPKGNPKQRTQVFRGTVLSKKGGNQEGATFRVRKVATGGVGVEKIFPLYSPSISKIEIIKKQKVRRAKLYFLRNYRKKLKEIKD